MAALKDYQQDPRHKEIAQFMVAISSERRVVDYEA